MLNNMNDEEASSVLGVAVDSAPDARKQAFETQKDKLQLRLAEAATYGLKSKYIDALKRLEEAYETLELHADADHLPSLRRDVTHNVRKQAAIGLKAKCREVVKRLKKSYEPAELYRRA